MPPVFLHGTEACAAPYLYSYVRPSIYTIITNFLLLFYESRARVPLSHDWRLKSMPPWSYDAIVAAQAATFHKSNVRVVHGFLCFGGGVGGGGSALCSLEYDEAMFYGARLWHSFHSAEDEDEDEDEDEHEHEDEEQTAMMTTTTKGQRNKAKKTLFSKPGKYKEKMKAKTPSSSTTTTSSSRTSQESTASSTTPPLPPYFFPPQPTSPSSTSSLAAASSSSLSRLCKPVLLRDAGRLHCLPLFTIVGAQKGGTTSLFSWLQQHPLVGSPAEKELNFFGNPWPLGVRRNRRKQTLAAFTFNYLHSFPLTDPVPRGDDQSDSENDSAPTNRSGSISSGNGANANANAYAYYDAALLLAPEEGNPATSTTTRTTAAATRSAFLRAFSSAARSDQRRALERLSRLVSTDNNNNNNNSNNNQLLGGELRVYGEASPDYLVSATALPNMLRFVPAMKVIVSLRDPVERCVSAYFNKAADGTVHRHMQRRLFRVVGGKVDTRSDAEVLADDSMRRHLQRQQQQQEEEQQKVQEEQEERARRLANNMTVATTTVDATTVGDAAKEKENQKRGGSSAERPLVPTLLEVIAEMNATLFRCPDRSWHYTLAEVPTSSYGAATTRSTRSTTTTTTTTATKTTATTTTKTTATVAMKEAGSNSSLGGGAGNGAGAAALRVSATPSPASAALAAALAADCFMPPFVLHGYYGACVRACVRAGGRATSRRLLLLFLLLLLLLLLLLFLLLLPAASAESPIT